MSAKFLLLFFLALVVLAIDLSAARPEPRDQENDGDLFDPLCVGQEWLEPLKRSNHNRPHFNCLPHKRHKPPSPPPKAPSPSQAPRQPETPESPPPSLGAEPPQGQGMPGSPGESSGAPSPSQAPRHPKSSEPIAPVVVAKPPISPSSPPSLGAEPPQGEGIPGSPAESSGAPSPSQAPRQPKSSEPIAPVVVAKPPSSSSSPPSLGANQPQGEDKPGSSGERWRALYRSQAPRQPETSASLAPLPVVKPPISSLSPTSLGAKPSKPQQEKIN